MKRKTLTANRNTFNFLCAAYKSTKSKVAKKIVGKALTRCETDDIDAKRRLLDTIQKNDFSKQELDAIQKYIDEII